MRDIVLLLDLAAENPIDEAMVRAQLPAGAAPLMVFRLTDLGPVRAATGTPDRWPPVMAAIGRMVDMARGPEHDGRCRYWIAGRAGLPAFFYLGYRLSKKAAVTLVHPRDAGPIDVLQLDAPRGGAQPRRPYFSCSPWPVRPSHSQAAIGLIVSSRIRIAPEQVEDLMSRRGDPPAAIVEAQARGWLDAASVAPALEELADQIAGIQTWYPRCTSLSVFLAGPATLAFLVGRAVNPHIFPDVRLFQHRNHQYALAYETRSRPSRQVVLFLASNPASTTRLALDEEIHDIAQELRRSEHRDRFELKPQLAPRVTELRRSLQSLQPAVVHFSGHGTAEGLVLHEDDGAIRTVTAGVLRDLFQEMTTPPRVVVLNACFSEPQAEALLEHVACVVGMPDTIGDRAARRFAVAFYGALGDGASVRAAFELAREELRSQHAANHGCGARDINAAGSESGSDESLLPRLLVRAGVDPGALVLVSNP